MSYTNNKLVQGLVGVSVNVFNNLDIRPALAASLVLPGPLEINLAHLDHPAEHRGHIVCHRLAHEEALVVIDIQAAAPHRSTN